MHLPISLAKFYTCDVLRCLVPFKNTHGGVLLLVKLQAWCQIAQRIPHFYYRQFDLDVKIVIIKIVGHSELLLLEATKRIIYTSRKLFLEHFKHFGAFWAFAFTCSCLGTYFITRPVIYPSEDFPNVKNVTPIKNLLKFSLCDSCPFCSSE